MAGFHERAYEFLYNMEFCRRTRGLVAAAPYLPSFRAEEHLGYDVKHHLEEGNRPYSVFLQHKVPHYAENRQWNNTAYYDCHDGPYYRIVLDPSQQDTLLRTMNHEVGMWFYCTPAFHLNKDLQDHYEAGTIMINSVWISPLKLGALDGQDRACIMISADAQTAHFHPGWPTETQAANEPHELPRFDFFGHNVADAEEYLRDRVVQLHGAGIMSKAAENARPIERLQYLVGKVLGLTWYVLPDPQAANELNEA